MQIIALEGVDKAGKETQVAMLVEAMKKSGYSVAASGFPRYNTSIGRAIKRALHNELEITDMELAKLYELDKYHAQEDWRKLQEAGVDYLILDRYTMSNMVFGQAKGMSEIDLLWLQHGLMPADLHIVVDISVEESLRRGQAYQVLDKNETNTALLSKVREIQLEYAASRTYYDTGTVVKVNGEQDVDSVHRDILKTVTEELGYNCSLN